MHINLYNDALVEPKVIPVVTGSLNEAPSTNSKSLHDENDWSC